MYQSTGQKIKSFILALIAQYLISGIVVGIIILWYFFPEIIDKFGLLILFWGPVIVLVVSFSFGLIKINFRAKKDEQEGIYQYEIVLVKSTFYLIEFVIYI